jgi:hypothetical protein
VQTQADEESQPPPSLSDCEWGSSCECRVPQFRHRRVAPAEFARLVLSFYNLLRQLDSGNRYRRVVESLESQHGPDSLLHSPMVLLHPVVQVLAGADLQPPVEVRRVPSSFISRTAQGEAA